MHEKLRLAIIGCGGISQAHGNASKARPVASQAQFVACCDVREDAAKGWAAQHSPQAAAYTDYEQMIREQSLDGVLLATWPNQHREQVERCLSLGIKNILCEKALTLTGQEAAEMWRLTRSAKAFMMEGFMYRHHPVIRRMEALIAGGEIGAVDNIRAEFGWYQWPAEALKVPREQRDWRLRRECGGGVPYDATCYAVNACGHFARSLPTRAMASGTEDKAFDVLMRLFGIIDYANGVNGYVGSSHEQQFVQELQIQGAGGHLFLPLAWTIYDEVTLQRRHAEGWAHVLVDEFRIGKADSYALQLENFIAVIQGRAKPVLPLTQSVVNTYVIEALVTSALAREPVDIRIPADVAAEFGQVMEERP